jgi:hypothetical protein
MGHELLGSCNQIFIYLWPFISKWTTEIANELLKKNLVKIPLQILQSDYWRGVDWNL